MSVPPAWYWSDADMSTKPEVLDLSDVIPEDSVLFQGDARRHQHPDRLGMDTSGARPRQGRELGDGQ